MRNSTKIVLAWMAWPFLAFLGYFAELKFGVGSGFFIFWFVMGLFSSVFISFVVERDRYYYLGFIEFIVVSTFTVLFLVKSNLGSFSNHPLHDKVKLVSRVIFYIGGLKIIYLWVFKKPRSILSMFFAVWCFPLYYTRHIMVNRKNDSSEQRNRKSGKN